MEIFNDTPFEFAYLAGRMPFPGHSLTLIVKATFDLVPDGEVVPSAEQQLPTGDEFYEGDEEMLGGPRYASDFACYKPLADLMLVGHCHAPKDRLVPARKVSFQVGDVLRSLSVYGDRYWTGPIATEPEPFSRIELRYDRSYGGRGYEKNPTGMGYAKTEDPDGNSRRYLPNVMHPDDQMTTPFSRLNPAGFGPVNREWHLRKSKLGTYKGRYLKDRWPWFAEDMDWRYFNAAPDHLQTAYLKGEESLYFENLHPVHQSYRSRLAGIRARCFVNAAASSDTGAANFQEVGMNLDTLWVDMDAEKVVLTWRGWIPVLSEEFEEIQQILVAAEPLEEPSEPVSFYERLLHQRRREEKELWEETEPPVEPQPQIDGDVVKLTAEAENSYRKALAAAGLDPDNPPGPSEADKVKADQILRELGFEGLAAPAMTMTRQHARERFAATADLSGLNLSGLDLSGLDFSRGNLQGAVLARADLSGTIFDGADLTGAVLSAADLSGASLKKVNLTDGDCSTAVGPGLDLSGATLTDAIWDGARLEQSNMEEADARGASFIGADLTGANLARAQFCNADLSSSNLTRANLAGSDLTETSLEGARGVGVVMDGADLTELRASEKCVFTEGSFKRVTAKESIWEEADLRAADFSFAQMEGASFAKANLANARLRAAHMKSARFERANLESADLALANCFESRFEKADLSGCDCRQANLYGSEFLDAIVATTRFEGANLKMTKLADR